MTTSRKHKLLAALILVCVCIPALATEPNKAKAKLVFEISNEGTQWTRMDGYGRGPIKPTHVAEIFIGEKYVLYELEDEEQLEAILRTPAGRSLSTEQREFLTKTLTPEAIFRADYGDVVDDHHLYRLYAVSQEDAKKMAEALVQALSDTHTKRHILSRVLARKQDELRNLRKQLKNYEPDADIHLKFKSSQREAAAATIIELDKGLITLDIEIAGIQAKLKAVQEFQAKGEAEGFMTEETPGKLEIMFIDLTVELRAAEAKRMTIHNLKHRAGEHHNMWSREVIEWQERRTHLDNASDEITLETEVLQRKLTELAKVSIIGQEQPSPSVYKNKVSIFPVRASK